MTSSYALLPISCLTYSRSRRNNMVWMNAPAQLRKDGDGSTLKESACKSCACRLFGEKAAKAFGKIPFTLSTRQVRRYDLHLTSCTCAGPNVVDICTRHD